jgi:sucrose phosphorylase
MEKAGGETSMKQNDDGSESPYEINISWFDALGMTVSGKDDLQEERFLCSQVIMLALKGIPAFYIHNLTATGNDYEKYKRTGTKRDLNRKNWNVRELEHLLDQQTRHSRVFNRLQKIAKIRKAHSSFHPEASQKVLEVSQDLFAIQRRSGRKTITSVSNVTAEKQKVGLPEVGLSKEKCWVDLLLDESVFSGDKTLVLEPYQTVWMAEK